MQITKIKQLVKLLAIQLLALLFAAFLLFCTGCASVQYGPLKVNSLGTDVTVDSATWIKTTPDGTQEALTVVGGKRNSTESIHTVANTSAAILGAIIASGTPAGPAGGAAGGLALAEAWQSLQDWLRKGDPQVALPQVALPQVAPSPTVNPVNPVNPVPLSDDPACELVIKYQERELHNSGQVTYLKRLLTSRTHEGARPVCVQYNDTASGETTVWKDQSNQNTKVDSLPTDRGINKIVVWYE